MKKRAGLIGQTGHLMVLIGLTMMLANSPERPIAAAVWITAGIVVAICGGLAGKMSWFEIASLAAIFIAVLFYFFTDNTLANFFMVLAVILVAADLIIRFKNRTASRRS
ncbi:hypothetical protein [Planococcus shenhongbingii]|uniref:Uncharacterized protein n=1 Tax=Planococcus shenhongbingii TaxID=3058398 RepID=A0ABT8NDM3_9BACL|nr:hypothetical protein [Planococcus sp. N017]MDN7245615.1 hypothetical protein [Planococcus sp. N017]